MRISRIFAILQIIIVVYMIIKELTTPYIYKHSSDIILPAILFFSFLIIGLYFQRKEKKSLNRN